MLVPRLYTAPAAEPVTLADALAHLRLETAEDNAYVGALITAAREYIEQICWRGLVTQTWEVVGPCFPDKGDGIELPRGNLVAVASVKYVDTAGVLQTFAVTTGYVVDLGPVPGKIRLAYGVTDWPTHRDQWDAVRIQYSVGWAVGSVPKPLTQALLLLLSEMYEKRSPEVLEPGSAFDALVRPYRLNRP